MTLREMIEEAGYAPESYSGRGMNGERCVSVSLDGDNALGTFIADMMGIIAVSAETSINGGHNAVIAAFRGMRTDSLGLGIVVYFPRVKWEER